MIPPSRERRGTARCLAGGAVRLHGDESGQAMFVVVVFFFLLAALLLLVLNTGEKLNHKVEMQGAADSTAATAAAWYARGLNTISMCNVTESQLLSLIVLCDTLETVVPPAQECIDDLLANLGKTKARKDIPLDARVCDPDCSDKPGSMFLVVGNADSERTLIRRFGDIVRAVPWPEYLRYDSGVLWECTKLMDGLMHAMAQDTPRLACREALAIAKKNHADFGFAVPLWPQLPIVDGQFEDFKQVMCCARLYGHEVAPGRQCALCSYSGGQLIGGFGEHVMHYLGSYYRAGYYRSSNRGRRVMGPWQFWREPFAYSQPLGMMDLSTFSSLFNLVSLMKFEMLFGHPDYRVSLKDWEMDYDKFKGMGRTTVIRTWWKGTVFDARDVPSRSDLDPDANSPAAVLTNCVHYRDPGQWVRPQYPLTRPNGYEDYLSRPAPRSSNPPMPGVEPLKPLPTGWQRAEAAAKGADPRQSLWYCVTGHWTTNFPALGIYAPHPPNHPDGTPWPYNPEDYKPYYRVRLVRFNGAEKEEGDTTLHRDYLPPVGSSPELAPIHFDQATRQYTQANQDTLKALMTFNGFAYRSGVVQNWAKLFVNPNPIEDVVAYAQARVYMHRYASWDLFTQYWKVRLVRTDRWKAMIPLLNQSVPDGELSGELTSDRLKPVADMLNAYDESFIFGAAKEEGVAH